MRILITGGVKSGKSSRALVLARELFGNPKYFIATAEACDDEMGRRIERHRQERKNSDGSDEFITLEEAADLAGALEKTGNNCLIDCIPMWINNLMYYRREDDFDSLLENSIALLPENCIIVTNETGLGNIPFDEHTRRYNLLLAEANRAFAAAADRVELMVSGIPLRVK
ncbi:bifunctional adenosylcobinamide kinase/adenosylcobinamide-phosphate guanylyltransferase [Treponema sp. OttesenSCG-928-L16]|nr:bifunctional adenosylcobinamide kinase/adenosylcobinamide-phosphate guanylyltransferase [Treponema sp. OttesenSCG-928-L16]